jgi:hypothetical protein
MACAWAPPSVSVRLICISVLAVRMSVSMSVRLVATAPAVFPSRIKDPQVAKELAFAVSDVHLVVGSAQPQRKGFAGGCYNRPLLIVSAKVTCAMRARVEVTKSVQEGDNEFLLVLGRRVGIVSGHRVE